MNKITENEIELFAIELLEKQDTATIYDKSVGTRARKYVPWWAKK